MSGISGPRISPNRIARPMLPHRRAVYGRLPAFVEALRQFGLSRQQSLQPELDMRLPNLLVLRKACGNVLPAIGHAAGIEQHHAVPDDAEVFQMRIDGKDAELPSALPRVEKSMEPEFHRCEVARRRQPREPMVESIFDALG